MKPKGFGKNYFTLRAILAYSVAPKEAAREREGKARQKGVRRIAGRESESDQSPPLPPPCLPEPLQQAAKPCHCNRHFRRLAALLLFISEHFRRFLCRCRKTKTGLAPPSLILSSPHNNQKKLLKDDLCKHLEPG
ncbi:hypothetical protein [Hydrogenimonas sp.]